MRQTLLVPCLLALAGALPTGAWSQAAVETPSQAHVRPGAKVRVQAPAIAGSPLVGTVSKVNGDTLVLNRVGPRASDVVVPFSSLTELQVSRGRGPGVWIGAGVGLVAGGLIGAVVGAATVDECSYPCGFGEGWSTLNEGADAAAAGMVGGALVGAVVVAVIGNRLSSERWESVPLRRIEAAAVPRGGFNVSVSLNLPF